MSPRTFLVPCDFEDHWRACPAGHDLRQRRGFAFDSVAGLTYRPTEVLYERITLPAALPNDHWIEQAFVAFVKGEFTTEERDVPPFPGLPERVSTQAVGDEAAAYLASCERDLVYGADIEELIESSEGDTVAQLRAMLADKRLGNGRNQKNVTYENLAKTLTPLMEQELRVRFVMPAFPFKDQNPFRTAASPWDPDLGEIALLIRLHCLALAMWQVHPHGVDWILISDGVIYSEVFGVAPEHAREYVNRLRRWRNDLNMQRTVAIVDLAELIARVDESPYGDASGGGFSCVRKHIRDRLDIAIAAKEPRVAGPFSVLLRGMTWNLNLRGYKSQIADEELWHLARGGKAEGLSERGKQIHAEVVMRAREAAFDYAAFNLTVRHLDVFGRYVPESIRATIHPKPGQIAVPSLSDGGVFPWNGVALHRGSEFDHRSVTVRALSDLTRRHPRVLERQMPGGAPFYYSPAE